MSTWSAYKILFSGVHVLGSWVVKTAPTVLDYCQKHEFQFKAWMLADTKLIMTSADAIHKMILILLVVCKPTIHPYAKGVLSRSQPKMFSSIILSCISNSTLNVNISYTVFCQYIASQQREIVTVQIFACYIYFEVLLLFC